MPLPSEILKEIEKTAKDIDKLISKHGKSALDRLLDEIHDTAEDALDWISDKINSLRK